MEQAQYRAPNNSNRNNQRVTAKDQQKLAKPTPMMAQFLEIKAVNPGYLLFYRMGDFYELFFEDAEIAAQALGIVLTKRGKHLENDIPMCGVPVHAADNYLKKLISLGHKVAICEQLEDPIEAKKRGAKSVVKRDVVRLVSAGTITEDDLLPSNSNNYLCSIALIEHETKEIALAWADISTGETFTCEINHDQLSDELSRINPAELIISRVNLEKIQQNTMITGSLTKNITILEPEIFDSEQGEQLIRQAFSNLDINNFKRTKKAALGALITYISKAQKNNNLSLREPISENINDYLLLDSATRNSLEILYNNKNEAKGSLRHSMDLCSTPAGSRLLARRLAAPLTNIDKINARLDMVETLYLDNIYLTNLRKNIKSIPDISRALTRLSLNRAGARDLANLGRAIKLAFALSKTIHSPTQVESKNLPIGLLKIASTLEALPLELGEEIEKAIIDEPPLQIRDGGFINSNYDEQLDRQVELASKSRTIIAQLQNELCQETDIKNLKIKYNKMLGYFIEVPAALGIKLTKQPYSAKFIHRQSMKNVMRFSTLRLNEIEGEISRASSAALEIELEIFARLSKQILAQSEILRHAGDALAKLDLSIALAQLASERNYSRPKIDNSLAFKIIGGRHPVVEQTLEQEGKSFIINDCDLSGESKQGGQLWLITGPNMGGKSTFLRQNALIAILAQIGSFVPATSAHIGIIDRVFSRVGASDDIAKGRSTFMVEMVETATILNDATEKSLVILDEIGRGTSTFDGLSIAWASAEALNKINRSRSLFATHFHELTTLAKSLNRTSNHRLKVKEYRGELVFLHEVASGAADQSYGIEVAKLAGLPKPVLERARQVLNLLEHQPNNNANAIFDELPLFSQSPNIEPKPLSEIDKLLDNLRPDELTPLKAIELLYEIKRMHDASK